MEKQQKPWRQPHAGRRTTSKRLSYTKQFKGQSMGVSLRLKPKSELTSFSVPFAWDRPKMRSANQRVQKLQPVTPQICRVGRDQFSVLSGRLRRTQAKFHHLLGFAFAYSLTGMTSSPRASAASRLRNSGARTSPTTWADSFPTEGFRWRQTRSASASPQFLLDGRQEMKENGRDDLSDGQRRVGGRFRRFSWACIRTHDVAAGCKPRTALDVSPSRLLQCAQNLYVGVITRTIQTEKLSL